MAMLITKFNKLIASKVLWLFILGIIVISFIFWGTGESGTQAIASDQQYAGRLNGRKVKAEEYQAARRQAARVRPRPGEPEPDYNKLTWDRLAMLDEARRQGFEPTEKQVEAEILRAFSDPETGVFQADRWRSSLEQSRMRESTVRRIEREAQSLSMLMGLFAPGALRLTSQYDLEQDYIDENDQFVAEYALLPRSSVTSAVEVTEQDIQDYYEKNKEDFNLPEQRAVRYFSIPLSDYTEPDLLTEEELLAAYRPEDFATTISVNNGYQPPPRPLRSAISNEVAAAASPNRIAPNALGALRRVLGYDYFAGAEDIQQVATNKTFAEVRDQLRDQLALQHAAIEADEAASEVWITLSPTSAKINPTFEDAFELGIGTAATTTLFSATDPLPEIPDEDLAAFRRAAFELVDNPRDRVSSRPLEGAEAIYVLYLDRIEPSRTPPLDDVREQVEKSALQQKTAETLIDRADAYREAIQSAMQSENMSFEDAALQVSSNLVVTAIPPFSKGDGSLLRDPLAAPLGQIITDYNAGELTESLAVPGGRIIGFVQQRISADMAGLEEAKASLQIQQKLENFALSEDYLDFLRARSAIKPNEKYRTGDKDD